MQIYHVQWVISVWYNVTVNSSQITNWHWLDVEKTLACYLGCW